MECFTSWEAESEASAAALQVLQWGALRVKIFYVSSARSEESEERCNEVLSQAGKLYYALKSVLSSWGDNMTKVEVCYMELNHSAGEDVSRGADRLFELNMAAYVKLNELVFDFEEVKVLLSETHERVDDCFRKTPNIEACKYRGDFPGKIKVNMKLILQEMVNSLGWGEPVFDVACCGIGCYVCKVFLLPMVVMGVFVARPYLLLVQKVRVKLNQWRAVVRLLYLV